MNDKEIKCAGCGEIFILRQEETEYYQNRIKGDPKYCPICRKAYRKKQEKKQAEEEEFIGDDLTQKFQRIYKNGFY